MEEGLLAGAVGLARRAARARMSKRAFGTRLESEAVELEQGLLADLPNTSLW